MAPHRSWQRASGKYAFLTVALLCADAGAETAPGTTISNQATFRATVDGAVVQGASNVASIVVAERLDVTLHGNGNPTTIDAAPTPVPTVLTNAGSGTEAFDVAASASRGVHVELIAIDRDGDGRYSPAVDQRLDARTPPLPPGGSVALVVLVAPDAAPVDGTLTVAATAGTGSGDPDRVLPGMGDGGGDAVVGRTGATAAAALPLVGSTAPATASLAKSQSVRAPDESSTPASGAVVTYTLVATFADDGARAARVEDPVPAGTSYVANSLTLDGAALTDAADSDAGDCDGRTVAVALGDRRAGPEPVRRTITFQVRLP